MNRGPTRLAGRRNEQGARGARFTERQRRLVSVGAPLAVALALLGLCVLLIALRQGGGAHTEAVTAPATVTEPQARATIASASELPSGSPTEKAPFAPRTHERFGGAYPRWNLSSYPEGWNEELALRLHAFFEAMQIDPMDDEALARLPDVRSELEDYLAQLGPDAVPTLATILNAEGDFVDRRFLLYALGKLGPETEASTWVLRDFFTSRFENPENRSEMIHVVKAMGELGNGSSAQMLIDFIKRDDPARNPALEAYRSNFVEALGEHPRKDEFVGVFVDVMQGDSMIPARNKAAQALGKVRSPQTLAELYHAVDHERYWVVRQTLLGSIGKIGSPESIPFLEKHARGAKESGVRLSAASAIRRINTPYGWALLRDIARSEPDPGVRERIEGWIEKEGS